MTTPAPDVHASVGPAAVTTDAHPALAGRTAHATLVHRALLVGCVAAIAWGAFAFGAVYRWAYTPLAAGCAAIGVVALVVERRGRPPLLALGIGLMAILAAIALQLVPLPLPTLVRVS